MRKWIIILLTMTISATGYSFNPHNGYIRLYNLGVYDENLNLIPLRATHKWLTTEGGRCKRGNDGDLSALDIHPQDDRYWFYYDSSGRIGRNRSCDFRLKFLDFSGSIDVRMAIDDWTNGNYGDFEANNIKESAGYKIATAEHDSTVAVCVSNRDDITHDQLDDACKILLKSYASDDFMPTDKWWDHLA
ncbi:MAG: hypothetical protein ACO2ZM_05520 [Francisellaceae bacterium]